ncbi:MAG: ABC-2 family transporter protein [Hyphomicrobiaceae bacterium]
MRYFPLGRYIMALTLLNTGSLRSSPWLAAVAAFMMLANNLIFFLVWIIYFGNFSNLGGWRLDDVALLVGLVSWSFGLTSFLVAGMRDIAQTIVDGRLDVHLGRPCHPLPTLLLSRSIPAGLGDLLSAFVFWLWFAGRTPEELPLIILVGTAAAVVVAATTTIFHCLVFWFPSALALCEELFNTLLMVVYYPQHPFGFVVRMALFSVFPAGLIGLLPAEAIRDPDVLKLLAMVAAAAVYAALAVAIFNRGLRRYASGNSMLELR